MRTNVILVLLSILVTFFVIEIGIRTIDATRGRGFFSNHRNLVASSNSRLPFRTFGFDAYQNIEGTRYISSTHGEPYPIEKPEGTFRIVAFGGSTTENLVAYRTSGKHYPLVLQSELRQRLGRDDIEVINVANSAYATPHALILLELDVLSWDPDLVILSHNANDRTAMYFPDFTFDYSNKYSDPYYMRGESFTTVNALFQHSQAYWVFRKQLDRIFGGSTTIKRKSYGDEPDPRGVEVFRRNLGSFVALAQSNGIEVLLATQPIRRTNPAGTDVGDINERPYNSYVFWPLPEEVPKHHAYYNGVIRSVAEETGSQFLDNAALMNNKEGLFFDNVHYTEKGVDELAGNYADFLIENGIVD